MDAADDAEKTRLLEELQVAGVNYDPDAVVKIARTQDGKIVFLRARSRQGAVKKSLQGCPILWKNMAAILPEKELLKIRFQMPS